MFVEILASLALTTALMLLFWRLRGVMLTPVKKGKNQRIDIVVSVTGASPELESTVDGLAWLVANGTVGARLVIVDDGMDEDTRTVARTLARRGVAVFRFRGSA